MDNENYPILVVRTKLGFTGNMSIAYVYGSNRHSEAFDDMTVFEQAGIDCVLLGADSIETLKQTHSNWVNDSTMIRLVSCGE